MKHLKRTLQPGCVFALPLPSRGYAVGIITHIGRWPALIGAFGLVRMDRIPVLSEAATVLTACPIWRKKFGPLGFSIGGWQILGNIQVPMALSLLPVLDQGPLEVLEIDNLTLQPVKKRPRRQSGVVMESGAAGHEFVSAQIDYLLNLEENIGSGH